MTSDPPVVDAVGELADGVEGGAPPPGRKKIHDLTLGEKSGACEIGFPK